MFSLNFEIYLDQKNNFELVILKILFQGLNLFKAKEIFILRGKLQVYSLK